MENQSVKKESKIYTILLITILVAVFILISFNCRQTINEINLLSSNISGLVIQDKDDSNEQEEPYCQAPTGEDVLDIKSGGYYYSPQGDQLGVGPLPPEVDIPTNIWVFWEITDFENNLDNFTITAQLPENVIWTSNKTLLAGRITFGEVGRRIVWKIDKIRQGNELYRVGFEVSVIPSQEDVGKILDLVTNIQYSAINQSCQTEIQGVLDNITTDLIFDDLAAGKGKVVQFLVY